MKDFQYSKLFVVSIFAKRGHYLPPKHPSRTNSCNIIGMNPSVVILWTRKAMLVEIAFAILLNDEEVSRKKIVTAQ